MKDETLAIHAGYKTDPTTKAVAVPIYQTVAYEFDNAQHGADLFNLVVPGNIYTRIMNPTQDVLEQRVAALEGGIAALALSSGQAATTYAILTIARAGSNVVSVPLLYGGTYTLFAHQMPAMGIDVRFAKDDSPAALEALIDDRTAAVFCETIGNPAGNIPDLEAITAMAHRHGVPVIVDNTVATPVLMQAHRLRRRYRRPLADEVHGRPWHLDRRHHCRFREVPLGGAQGPLPDVEHARTGLSRCGLYRGARSGGVHRPCPNCAAAQHRVGDQPVQRVPVPAGDRDAGAADGTARVERHCRGQSSGETPQRWPG